MFCCNIVSLIPKHGILGNLCFLLDLQNLFLSFRHDIINVNLKEKPEWFLKKNPLGLVPTLETSAGEVIYESSIVCDYLDEVYPEKKLLPSSAFAKAQQKMLLENFSKVFFMKTCI